MRKFNEDKTWVGKVKLFNTYFIIPKLMNNIKEALLQYQSLTDDKINFFFF